MEVIAGQLVAPNSYAIDSASKIRLVNFYSWFLRGAAGFLIPLTDALQGPGKSLAWSPPMDQAFNAAKSALATAAELKHP